MVHFPWEFAIAAVIQKVCGTMKSRLFGTSIIKGPDYARDPAKQRQDQHYQYRTYSLVNYCQGRKEKTKKNAYECAHFYLNCFLYLLVESRLK